VKSQQSGFTLVEIAIVLVIIGLLLGGILKGQELINSARVKNLANDFRTIPTYIYAYQDKFKALPGDDAAVTSHVAGATAATGGTLGNGVIEGSWNTASGTTESFLFWQHVRLANLAPGPTSTADATYRPTNAMGGNIGVQSNSSGTAQITGMSGTYQICSKGILGKFAIQLDVQMDDGEPCTGSIRAIPDVGTSTTPNVTAVKSAGNTTCTGATAIDPDTPYTVCMTF
jgi:prepilin-type N-terminal cleavage/methylation domain-containing protein